jgi:hypothetical protein
MRLALAAAFVLIATSPAIAANPPSLRQEAESVRDRALADPTAYDFVADLTTEVGARLAGSPAAARARDWGIARLKALGFVNVHAEAFPITAWLRGPESAAVVAPHPQSLAILGLGGSVPTPAGGIEAEALLLPTYADLIALPPGALAGKIAVVIQPMLRAQDGTGYGVLNPNRRAGPSEAARRGAIAYLVRSLSTGDGREPHTGQVNYKDDAPKIPAAALSVADSELLERMAAAGKPIRIRLELASQSVPGAMAWTVLGEIPGTERPDEVILVGGHLDSWDPGQGAIDDGAGMAIVTAAARLAAGPRRPKRTIRVALFGAEEMDFSDEAFAAAHKAEAAKLVIMGEADSGADRAWKVQLPAGAAAHPAMQAFAAAVAPLKVTVAPEPSTYGGSDIYQMSKAGVPTVSIRQDASRYFDWHHSADDTLDKIDREQLNQAVATWASFLFIAANADVDFRTPPATPAPPTR